MHERSANPPFAKHFDRLIDAIALSERPEIDDETVSGFGHGACGSIELHMVHSDYRGGFDVSAERPMGHRSANGDVERAASLGVNAGGQLKALERAGSDSHRLSRRSRIDPRNIAGFDEAAQVAFEPIDFLERRPNRLPSVCGIFTEHVDVPGA